LNVFSRVQRHRQFKAKTAFRMGGLKRRETSRTFQSAIGNRQSAMLHRHSGCRAGRHNALRGSDAGEQSNGANGSDAFTWRQFVRALSDPRARGNGACRWRVTAPRSPRARGFGNGKFFERAGCGETRRLRSSKKQRRCRG
jgi:hypothetical protein